MRFLWILLLAAPSWAQKSEGYQRWRDSGETMIRVGLKKPKRVIDLYSNNTLLVLDGDRVISQIKPGGAFKIIADKSQSGSEFWVQIKAAYNRTSLEKERDRMLGKHPDLDFMIMSTSNRMKALRVGPLPTRSEMDRVRKLMQSEGVKDAFPVTSGGAPFYWVNSNFDKFPLRASDLALVRTNPDLPISFEGVKYRGVLRFRLHRGKIRVINVLPLETYLRGVVPSELGPRVYPEVEALKAQAVAARTYVLKNMGRFNKLGYDICDGPACQAYDGVKNEMALSDEAVAATRGLVMLYEGKLIDALYTSTSGGHTEDVEHVFPGRAEPYLRGKSEYIADFQSWNLPERKVNRKNITPQTEDLAARLMIYGFAQPPVLDGMLDGKDLSEAFKTLSWIFGDPPEGIKQSRLTHRDFWENMAKLDFFQRMIQNQVHPEDMNRLLRGYGSSDSLRGFATLMLRYDLLSPQTLDQLGSTSAISRLEAYEHLLVLARALGPEPEWTRYLMEGLDQNRLQTRRGFKPSEIDLTPIKWYVAEEGERLKFMEQPTVEERDRLYTLKPPFSNRFLKIRQNGGVASIDRFSVFDFWVEKKDTQTLEKRARRYIRGIKDIRDVRITKRTETGRVEEIEFITGSGNHKATGLNIRWSLGIRDNMFDMLPNYKNGRLVHITFMGRGWGHGVGMSQVGAFGLARMGWDFRQILSYYYTDIEIRPTE